MQNKEIFYLIGFSKWQTRVYGTVLCLPGLLDQFPEYRMEPLEAEVSPIRFKLEE